MNRYVFAYKFKSVKIDGKMFTLYVYNKNEENTIVSYEKKTDLNFNNDQIIRTNIRGMSRMGDIPFIFKQ
jgi:hypothetical protein